MSKGSFYICVTVYYHLKHQPLVAMATEQHMACNIVQNQKKNLLHVSILNMIEWSKEFCRFDSIVFLSSQLAGSET